MTQQTAVGDVAPPRIVPVLAGGGTRLPAHVGVLAALQDLGYQYHHLVGVSGGSVVASLAAAGVSVERLGQLFRDIDFGRFRGHSLVNLLMRGGLSDGRVFERWLHEELGGARFADLAVDLHVVATDVRSAQPVVFDRHTTPDLPVARAVLYSISIPLLFPFHHHDRHVLVDGSILAEDARLTGVELLSAADAQEFKRSRHALPLALGESIEGQPMIADLGKMPAEDLGFRAAEQFGKDRACKGDAAGFVAMHDDVAKRVQQAMQRLRRRLRHLLKAAGVLRCVLGLVLPHGPLAQQGQEGQEGGKDQRAGNDGRPAGGDRQRADRHQRQRKGTQMPARRGKLRHQRGRH